jgi:hypothetical protein
MQEPIEIDDGEMITESGFYRMPIEHYHSQCCAGHSLSSTGIRQIIESPAKFWKYSELNPDHEETPEKKAFILGRAAHHLILGEADFDKHFIEQPETLYGKKWQANRMDCKEWIAEQKDLGKTVLTPNQVKSIRGMAGLLPWQKNCPNSGLANTPLVMQGGLLQGQIECSFIWKHQGVWLKARPDNIPWDSDEFNDLKTCGTGISNYDLTKSVGSRGYYVQGALVGMGSSAVLARQMQGFHLIFVEVEDEYSVTVKTIPEEDIILGEEAIHVAVGVFKHCMHNNSWPTATASANDAQNLPISPYNREDMKRRLDELAGAFQL